MDWNNLMLVEQHFCTNGPDFNMEVKFMITERIEKDINIKQIIKKKIRKQIDKKSGKYVPFRFSMKLNHLTWKLPSQLGLLNTPTAPLQRGKTPTQ